MTKKQADMEILRMMPHVRAMMWNRFYHFANRFFTYRCEEMSKRYPVDAPLKIQQRVRKYIANRDSYKKEHRDDNK